ncbi:HK97 family phage prohead protease [uncultured Microbulbifer sp.]|uniref:HK97 family phage prohead protease n=1 Tax=uncultured Microbulbifer sp. TaxID=348147 RepID=UPI0025DE00DB|nr:HK97 family phage prohead protease [uncultured Microbulbifer sp.]
MKAYSLMQVKAVDDEKRIITGMATTPTPDRVGDVVEPAGAVFRGPINLHLYHKHDLPVGNVEFGKATKTGIPFTATLPHVIEAGNVKDRVEEAWHSVKYKLLGAVSIGFRAMEDGVELLKSGGLRFTKWEMLELSLVSVPANPEAMLSSFKSADPAGIRSELGVTAGDDKERQQLINKAMGGAITLAKAPPSHPGSITLKK